MLDRGFQVSHGTMIESCTVISCAYCTTHCNVVQALQLLNSEYARALRHLQAARAEHLDADGVLFAVGGLLIACSWPSMCSAKMNLVACDVGTVFRHKQHGYKGVIYGWDRQCDRYVVDKSWQTQCCKTCMRSHNWSLDTVPHQGLHQILCGTYETLAKQNSLQLLDRTEDTSCEVSI